MDDVAAAHAEESEKSAAEVPVFGSGCIIEGFVNSGIDRNNAVEAFSKIGFAVNIFDRVVTGQLSFIDADNNPVSPFGSMADISSLPRLLPSLGNISLTMGVTPEVKQFVTSQLTKRIGMKSGLGVSLVADLLGDIDGDFLSRPFPEEAPPRCNCSLPTPGSTRHCSRHRRRSGGRRSVRLRHDLAPMCI